MQSAKEKLHKLYRLYEKPMYHIAYAVLHHTQPVSYTHLLRPENHQLDGRRIQED